ncbi:MULTISPECIES: capsular polysaccharide biosynthesis protein Cps4B [Streptococcus]|uniref:capsular polysaccharide biosynthesis protein Cps4B n=1 Tax=Streptococcus TaxID=1301 RepID=UPI00066D165E|nr:capsular polysaccharide biosynthesis protein Cps4B [Streptococcus anginosus]MCW1059161.1 tyrosine protein phosphatase [Streptococcus anginosus]MDU3555215.1 capsular polysaccharide biosynthesis protein Cps4B [Streptococcus anginosus]MDX5004117.1 capsular polysaccharide biosynthesis protein Cps4B [Streptococcus anginosus]MDX5025675.1 capsular polysaccharide biosynthesis protein Cps4B [Streptococcus anginosus]MDX5033470.1 capsular polysaccharide biosynthesis protein Cps4B [Streptococcus angino
MIDIHSHIVFDVDDGPKTRQDTRELLTESYRQGVRTIVSTSHRRKGMFETPEEKITANFHEVQQIAKEVADDLTILYGAEIYYTSDILEKLDKKIIPTLGGTSYALIEFSMTTPYREIHSALNNVLRLGITPVVAHIERYHCLENETKKVQDLINMGCYMQINSSSVLKPKLFGEKYKFMKKRAQFFMEQDLVHFVASDMHNLGPRPPYMQEAYQIISKKYGKAYADALFRENQEILLKDELI